MLAINTNLSDYLKQIDNSNKLNELDFSYVTETEFNNRLQCICNFVELSVLHLNVRSLNRNHRALCQFLEMLSVKFDVLILSEVWCTCIDSYCNLFPGYSFYYNLPNDSNVGGIGLYIKNTFTHRELLDYKIKGSDSNRVENTWFEISKYKTKYIVGGIYRHPNNNINEFTKEMDLVLGKLANQALPCIIGGDMNIDLTKCGSHSPTTEYVDNLLVNNFMPATIMPTRITPWSATLIDHLYYREGFKTSANTYIKSGNIIEDISDHLPNYLLLISRKKQGNNSRPMTRIFSEKNVLNFRKQLLETDWSQLYDIADANECYNCFISKYLGSFNRCFKLTKVSRKRSKDAAWITKGLKTSSRIKNQLYKQWVKNRNPDDEQKYKEYRKVFRQLAHTAEVTYYKELFDWKTNTSKQMWANLNMICSLTKSKSSKCNISKLIVDNKEVTTAPEICTKLNNYFASVGEKLVQELDKAQPLVDENEFIKYCHAPVKNSLFCRPVDFNELKLLIAKLKNSKSPGPDDIGSKSIKMSFDIIGVHLSHVFNLSIATGCVPEKLKMAKVIPLFKKGATYLPGNYRPISLLNMFDKLLEKIMYNRLYNHLQSNNILYEFQFGFRKNYSTTLALIEVIDNIYKNLDDGKLGVGIYLDLQKAFDTVNHRILLWKLYNYGVRGVVHDWFRSYLNNRRQFTCMSDVQSSLADITCGVPQGSVLGPLLFLVYINDIGNAVAYQKVKLFADDTNLFVFGDNASTVETDTNACLSALSNWFLCNKLSLNLSKTCYMIFSNKPCVDLNLSLNGQIIERVHYFKYLGVTIDDQLKWSVHIDNIYSKLIKFTSIFYRLRDKLPDVFLKDVYYAFVYTHILYGIELYANTTNNNLTKLITLHNKLLRILQNKPRTTRVPQLYANYNILPIPELHKHQLILFVYNYFYHSHSLPSVFLSSNYFSLNNHVHVHNTRMSTNAHIYGVKTVYGKRNTKYKAAVLWNELPENLQSVPVILQFKKSLKAYLLSLIVSAS